MKRSILYVVGTGLIVSSLLALIIGVGSGLFEETPRNTEVKISKEQAVELGREYLIGIRRNLTEAILKAEASEPELVYKRFSSAAIDLGHAPEGLWLCWVVKFTYTELPEGLWYLRWSIIYVQATTGEILFMDEAKWL